MSGLTRRHLIGAGAAGAAALGTSACSLTSSSSGASGDRLNVLHARLVETIGGLPPYYEGEAVEPVKR